MTQNNKIATVFGGSGFVGGYIAAALAKAGYRVQIISRTPERGNWVKTAAAAGEVVIRQGNIRDAKSPRAVLKGSDIVINAVGILYPSGKQTFKVIHTEAAENIAKAAQVEGVSQLIHISALGVDKATTSAYARSKLDGEKAVMAAFPNATILRPSVVFGAEDKFLNLFARMAQLSPALPLIGGGKTKFQPVYVGDITEAVLAALTKPESKGKTYQLGGTRIYTFKEILQFILATIDKKRCLIPIPFPIAKLQGFAMQQLPMPMLTLDQVKLLQYDNVVEQGALGFKQLGIIPRGLEQIAPAYLARYR